MNYEQDWGYKESDKNLLKAKIVAELPVSKEPGFLDSYNKPTVELASIATALTLPIVDVVANKAQVTWQITDIMNKTALNGHNTLQGLTFTSLLLLGSSVTIAKLDSVIAKIAHNNKINSSVNEFIKEEYKL